MNLQLLEIPKDNEPLIVALPKLDKYHVEYDFDNKKLNYNPIGIERSGSDYIISQDLIKAVNAAIVTGRPLLLKGEPGCGKTKLAKAVAVSLFENKKDVNKYYFGWFVKSKSQALEGCYRFDHIQRLRDARPRSGDNKDNIDVNAMNKYLSFGPFGSVLVANPPKGKPILVIDEIDKGDIDFPNDLLLELDELRFTIKEKDNISISSPNGEHPLVFITSNDERELPPAFLARCLIYRIPPFGSEMLEKIAASKLGKLYEEFEIREEALKGKIDVKVVVDKFITIRKGSVTSSPPSTSELLDWLKLITYKVHQGEDFKKVLDHTELQKLALKIM